MIEACDVFENAVQRQEKGYLRALHLEAKKASAGTSFAIAQALFNKHKAKFREGREIDPAKINPVLRIAADYNEWSELFFVVRSLWSMPYNKGYGRRLRFVIFDEHHQGVIGIVGLQSPPADLAVRDHLFDFPADRKLELINGTMDAYSVGAVPPYSYLLGGKLCAGLISTDTVRHAYWRRYAGQKSQMLDRGIRQPLVAVTTTSAFGRSSQYNRLKYKERLLAEPIGYTTGFGTLHLEHLYQGLCDHLKMLGRFKEGGFGSGPRVRWQNIVRALNAVNLPASMLQHGVKREVFLYRLVDDLESGMSGDSFGSPIALSESDYSNYWLNRWALPRAERFPTWNEANGVEIVNAALGIQAAAARIP